MPIIHSALSPDDYRVTPSLSGIDTWQARILLGNSMPDDKNVGDWDDVGYVMVAIRGETGVIPIARCDEHEMGFDLLRKRAKRWKIKPGDFFPVFRGGSATGAFLYSDEDRADALVAFERWHASGGPEVTVRWDGGAPDDRWLIGSRDFLSGKGTAVPSPAGLLPIGQRLVDRLSALADAVAAARDRNQPWLFNERGGNIRIRQAADGLCAFLDEHGKLAVQALWDPAINNFNGGVADLDGALGNFRAKLDTALAYGDIEGLSRAVFSHNGVKNRLHMAIRSREHIMQICFGDLDLANDAIGYPLHSSEVPLTNGFGRLVLGYQPGKAISPWFSPPETAESL